MGELGTYDLYIMQTTYVLIACYVRTPEAGLETPFVLDWTFALFACVAQVHEIAKDNCCDL